MAVQHFYNQPKRPVKAAFPRDRAGPGLAARAGVADKAAPHQGDAWLASLLTAHRTVSASRVAATSWVRM